MSEKGTAQGIMDPTRLWREWQDATAKMWSGVLESNNAANTDPFNLYSLWLKNVGEAQAQAWSLVGVLDPRTAWKQWFEASGGAWKNIAGVGADPLGLTTAWLETLEETRSKMLVGEPSPAASFEFFKQWYDATSDSWAKSVGSLFASEQFMEAVKQFLESYSGFAKTLRKANEEYFHGLQLPTRSDTARLGELIVALEEKVDHLDDAFGEYTDEASQDSNSAAIASLTKRLDLVERKLDAVLAALEKQSQAPAATEQPTRAPRKTTRKPAGK